MGSYWERVTTLVCDIVETCSVLLKIYLICFEYKKDFKVHKIASGECVNKLMECALSQNDDRLVRVLNCDDFVLKGVYHNGYMTKYLLKSSPKIVHCGHFLQNTRIHLISSNFHRSYKTIFAYISHRNHRFCIGTLTYNALLPVQRFFSPFWTRRRKFKGLPKNAIIRNMNVSVRLSSGTTIT
jgi:hypothetical protein